MVDNDKKGCGKRKNWYKRPVDSSAKLWISSPYNRAILSGGVRSGDRTVSRALLQCVGRPLGLELPPYFRSVRRGLISSLI